MFDKQRQSLEASKNYQKVKAHVQAHKTAYTVGASSAGCLIVGGVFGSKLGKKVEVTAVAKNAALVNWNPSASVVQETIINIPAKADRGHVIIDAVTKLPVGASLSEAAGNEGISRTSLMKHTRGLTEFAPNGKKYIDLGENLSEQLRITVQ